MDIAQLAVLRTSGTTDVGINGTPAGVRRVFENQIAPDRLRLVRALSETDAVPEGKFARAIGDGPRE